MKIPKISIVSTNRRNFRNFHQIVEIFGIFDKLSKFSTFLLLDTITYDSIKWSFSKGNYLKKPILSQFLRYMKMKHFIFFSDLHHCANFWDLYSPHLYGDSEKFLRKVSENKENDFKLPDTAISDFWIFNARNVPL